VSPRDPLRYIDLTPHAADDRDAHRYRGLALVCALIGVVVIAVMCWP
jgi:hypothetical protein